MNSIHTSMVDPLIREYGSNRTRDIRQAFASFINNNSTRYHAYAAAAAAAAAAPTGEPDPEDVSAPAATGNYQKVVGPQQAPAPVADTSAGSKDKKKKSSDSKKKDDKSKSDSTTTPTTPATTTTPPATTTTTTTPSQTPVADGITNAFHNAFTSFCGSGKGIQFLCKDEGTFTMFAFALIFAVLVYLMKKK